TIIQSITKDSKQKNIIELEDKAKNKLGIMQSYVDNLQKYSGDIQTASQSIEEDCRSQNNKKVEGHAKKAKECIDKSPKQVEMTENTLKEIQSIKKDIETLILQNESEQQKIKLEKPKGLKKPKAPKKTKTRKQLAEEAKAQEKQKKKEKAKLELEKKIAQEKADQDAKIASDFNSSIIPQNVFDFLFTLDQTFERDCKTRAYMYGSCLVKLALGHMAMNNQKSSQTPDLEVLKKIIVNDNDITVA